MVSITGAPAYKTVQFLCNDTCTSHVAILLKGRTSKLTTDYALKLWELPGLKFGDINIHNELSNLSCRFLRNVLSIRFSNPNVWLSSWLLMENFSRNWHASIFVKGIAWTWTEKFGTSLLYTILLPYITCCYLLSHLTKFLLLSCWYYQVQHISIENVHSCSQIVFIPLWLS